MLADPARLDVATDSATADNVLERCCSDATGDGRSAHANRTLLRACKAAVEHDQYLQLKLIEAASRGLPSGLDDAPRFLGAGSYRKLDERDVRTRTRPPSPGALRTEGRESLTHRLDAPRDAPPSTQQRNLVEIPKDKILDLLREQGKSDQVDQAEQELPDQVDPERHSGLLEKFGLQPQDVLTKLGDGIPGL